MKSKRILCFLLCVCILLFPFRISASENQEDAIQIYLDAQLISEDTVRVSICISENFGFCGGLFYLYYNQNHLSYAFCLEGDILNNMHLTPSLADSGKVCILLDSTKNMDADGSLAHLYFRIKDIDADMLKFEIFGADDISLVRLENGEILPISCDFLGCRLPIGNLPTVVGFQPGKSNIRIVCAGNDKYDILGINVRAVYPESHKIEEFIYYGYAYKKLCGSEKIPLDYGAQYFFLGELKIEKETVCLFVTPFGYDDEETILGKEKTLLFYKGEYI